MENGELRTNFLLFFGGLSLLMLGACASTPQQTSPVEPTADAKPLGRKALDALNPGEIAKGATDILFGAQRRAYEEAEAAYREIRHKIEEIDVPTLNVAIAELRESLEAMHAQIVVTSTESIGPMADRWRDSAETLEEKIDAIETVKLNDAMRDASLAAASWASSSEEFRALLTDVRALLAGVDSKQITETVEQVRQSAESLRLATAKLPSTTSSLSTTIWLLNGLLAVGVTLGVIRVAQHRTKKL